MPETDQYFRELISSALSSTREQVGSLILCDKVDQGSHFYPRFEAFFRPVQMRIWDKGFDQDFVDWAGGELRLREDDGNRRIRLTGSNQASLSPPTLLDARRSASAGISEQLNDSGDTIPILDHMGPQRWHRDMKRMAQVMMAKGHYRYAPRRFG